MISRILASRKIFIVALCIGAQLGAQNAKVAADPPGEWHNYNRDLGSSRYSPLSQIDRANVSKLAVAFVWKPDSGVAPREFKNESTPLMVHGVLYFTTALNRDVVAADATTGNRNGAGIRMKACARRSRRAADRAAESAIGPTEKKNAFSSRRPATG